MLRPKIEGPPVETDKSEKIDTARKRAAEILSASKEDVNLYIKTRRQMEIVFADSFYRPEPPLLLPPVLPSSVAEHLDDPEHPSVQAAFMMAAVAHRAGVYAKPESQVPPFSEFWGYYKTWRLARESEMLVQNLLPRTDGLFVHIDLTAIRNNFWQSIDKGQQEGIIITGPDGSGKSTVVRSLVGFLARLGLQVSTVKFPRPDSTAGTSAKSVLRDNTDMDPRALQFLMLADVLNFSPENDTLTVYDRHPIADSLIYGPPGPSEISLLAARECFVDRPHWLVITERHPTSCLERTQGREGKPERFEQGVEQITEHLVRFAGLTAFPGAIWVNNDFPTTDMGPDQAIGHSAQRVVAGLASKQVIQRALTRQGVCSNLAKANFCVQEEFLNSWKNKLF